MTRVASDASVRGQAAAWGAVIRREDGGELRLRGPLPSAPHGSVGAELEAMYRALRATRRDERVEIATDSTRVLAWVLGAVTPPRRLRARVLEVQRMIRRRRAVLRWTPAHRAGEEPLHREADRLARRALRAAEGGVAVEKTLETLCDGGG